VSSVDFRGERRSNATHQSTTEPEARLAKKSRGAQVHLAYVGHALMENRHGLLVDFALGQASGTAERDAALQLVDAARRRGFHPRTLGADKAYDTRDCAAALRQRGVTPHALPWLGADAVGWVPGGQRLQPGADGAGVWAPRLSAVPLPR
jgi:hypothetical protein